MRWGEGSGGDWMGCGEVKKSDEEREMNGRELREEV